jgi:hypothetical protein
VQARKTISNRPRKLDQLFDYLVSVSKLVNFDGGVTDALYERAFFVESTN